MAIKKTTKSNKRAATRQTFPDTAEGKQQRFAFYASLRMTRTLKLITQLKNLTNTVIYTSTPEQRRKMVDTLQGAVAELESKYFQVTGEPKGTKFQF